MTTRSMPANAGNSTSRVGSGGAGEDLEPEGFEKRHADDVLAFFAHFDVLEENPLHLETKSAVQIDVAHVDVAGVNVNLVQVADHECVVEKAEGGPFADALALQPGFTDELFHL